MFINSNYYVNNDVDDNNINEKKFFIKEDHQGEPSNLYFNHQLISAISENSLNRNNNDIPTKLSNATASKNNNYLVNNKKGEINKNYYNPQINNNIESLNQKRLREDFSNKPNYIHDINSNSDNFINNNSNMNPRFNLNNINSENLANLQNIFPNLNFLSQNMGLINWVVPGEMINNNPDKNDEKKEKL